MKLAALLCAAAMAQTGPTPSVYSDLQGWAVAHVRLQLDDNDQELFDGLLTDISGYDWTAANQRTVEIPQLQQWATSEIRLKLSDQDKALLDALLADLRRFKWTVRASAE